MLILSRKVDETVLIGPDIEVVVLKVSYGQVKLGIRAPHDVVVLRDDVYERIVLERPEAAERIWREGVGWAAR